MRVGGTVWGGVPSGVVSLQETARGPHFLVLHPRATGWSRKDGIQQDRLQQHRGCHLSVSVSLSDHAFRGKPAAKPWAALWRSPRSKELSLLSTATKWAWKQIPLASAERAGMGALTDSLTVTSQETLSQNVPAKLLPNSWPWGTLWDNKSCFKLVTLQVMFM